jgi:O-antigen/teichoic acid export membrane protein
LNPIKKLLGQTVIYGVSSIVGRIINFLLVPLYTNVLNPDEYGLLILMYSFVAIIYVFLIYGMETAYFRYNELVTEKKKVYNTSLISIIVSSLIFIVLSFCFSTDIASLIKQESYSNYVQWFVLIMALDAIAAIPFAKLRADNRPIRFATIKLINIGVNVGLNLFFILLCPFVLNNYSSGLLYDLVNVTFKPELGLVAYVFISNLIASFITILMLLPEIFKVRLQIDFLLWKKLTFYGFPLLIIGFAFAMNEMFGRILMNYLLPEEIALNQVGIYSASYKLAILLSLFVQAFRYAAEPFFFAQDKEKNSRKIYAQVMKYFVIIMAFSSLGILLYLDVIKLIIGREFRGAIGVIPILLLAYIFIGIFYNLSVWYKLTNKTIYGAVLALVGTLITVVLNFVLIPIYGYWGSAWATLSCYFAMMVFSYFWGRKKFKVKYELKKIITYLIVAFLLYYFSTLFSIDSLYFRMLFHTLLMGVFVSIVLLFDWSELKSVLRK